MNTTAGLKEDFIIEEIVSTQDSIYPVKIPHRITEVSRTKVKGLFVQFLSRFLATGFYSGYFPIAPGTVGSVLAFIPYLLFPGFRGEILLAASVLFFFIGVWAATQTEKSTGLHDPSIVNLDEVVGQWVALLFLPEPTRWPVWIGAFLLFRLFDIVKPPPANQSQNLTKGWGVMIDDVIAGIYANIILQIVLRII